MDWLLEEIATGFQKLLCLSLDRTPAGEVIPGTAQAWFEALTFGREWDRQRDTPRIRRAFVTLAQTQRMWPAPRDFIEALPPAPAPKLIARGMGDPEVAAKALGEIGEILAQPTNGVASRRAVKNALPLGEIEAQLKAHYQGGERE